MTVTSTGELHVPTDANRGRRGRVLTAGPVRRRPPGTVQRLATAPVDSANTTGRAVLMAAAVIRYIVQDVISLRF
ncbi:hypothetical protein MUNTM_15430 [Mycobacterium sp. MUNTM1]